MKETENRFRLYLCRCHISKGKETKDREKTYWYI